MVQGESSDQYIVPTLCYMKAVCHVCKAPRQKYRRADCERHNFPSDFNKLENFVVGYPRVLGDILDMCAHCAETNQWGLYFSAY